MKSVGQLKINLAAIQKNWQQFDRLTSSNTNVAAVVKADAYGLGAKPVVKALFEEGCNSFFVATLREAFEVKLAVSEVAPIEQRAPDIYILSAIRKEDFPSCVEEAFIPVLYSVDQIKNWAEYCVGNSIDPQSAIKVDTGMHRLGISKSELLDLVEEEKTLSACHPVLMMSHLACADDNEHPLNEEQLQCFEACAESFRSLFPEIKLSLSNSSGVFLGAQYHFDIVRAGIGLYGGNPAPYEKCKMLPVVNLDLPIAQVKEVVGPAAIGYGATFAVSKNEKIKLAVALGGYADGIFRSLSNAGEGFVAGKAVPMVGRVSMDSVIFDVSCIEDNLLKNASVSLMGPDHVVDKLAGEANTISYEILTSLGDRYDRNYVYSIAG
ncbi:MAG: alanine racemase [Cellvibrionaceae bacterium]